MPFSQVPFPQLVNFCAALRKPMLLSSGFYSPGDATSWIASLTTGGTGAGTQTGFNQSPNGVLVTFTPTTAFTNGLFVYLNGVFQTLNVSFSISGANVIFATAPQAGDVLQAIVY